MPRRTTKDAQDPATISEATASQDSERAESAALDERQLFAIVYRRMSKLAGSQAGDLDDLVQLAAVQVFASFHSFSGRSQLTTWVYSICYRVLLRERSWYRRFQLRFVPEEQAPSVASDDPLPSVVLETLESVGQLRSALARLSDKYRAVVVLHELEELEVREIAEIVGASEATVRSRLRDGRKKLSQLLGADSTVSRLERGEHELTPL